MMETEKKAQLRKRSDKYSRWIKAFNIAMKPQNDSVYDHFQPICLAKPVATKSLVFATRHNCAQKPNGFREVALSSKEVAGTRNSRLKLVFSEEGIEIHQIEGINDFDYGFPECTNPFVDNSLIIARIMFTHGEFKNIKETRLIIIQCVDKMTSSI